MSHQWLAALASATAVATALIVFRRHQRRLATLPPRATSCTLRWGHSPETCFCRPTIRLDLAKHQPDAELIAAIFGSPVASHVTVTRDDGSVVTPMGKDLSLALDPGETYTVMLGERALARMRKVTPIKSIALRVGSEDAVATLSRAFYRRVFDDCEDSAFRAFFLTTNKEAAAEQQWRWLVEMWGGEPRYTQAHGGGAIVHRMLSKHDESREPPHRLITHMQSALTGHHAVQACRVNPPHTLAGMRFRFCKRWLEHMVEAVDEVCMGGCPTIGEEEAIARYWLHFFGFFPMKAEERRVLRMLALGVPER